jgi:hypothetical protein
MDGCGFGGDLMNAGGASSDSGRFNAENTLVVTDCAQAAQ